MSQVDIRGLTKRFGSVVAVDDVSLHLKDGEFFGLLGPSGSGKTTLMRCIAGFIEQDAGVVQIDSIDLQGIPTHRRDIGMVFQNYALFPHMTVFQNVSFALKVRGRSRSEMEGRVAAMLAMVQLSGYENRLPRELSGGQQQRIALARAMISNPRVLLLDEPLNALDKRLRQRMQIELKQIQRAVGITTIFVTHDQDEALSLCDRIAIFKDGRIAQIGTPAESYERPRTEFAAEFLGAANFFRGRSLPGRGRVALDDGGEILTSEVLPPPGEPLTIVVRPEKFIIDTPDTPERGTRVTNQITGQVEKLMYLGSNTVYVVRVPSGELTVYQQNLSAPPLEPGTAVSLSWLPEHSVVLNTQN